MGRRKWIIGLRKRRQRELIPGRTSRGLREVGMPRGGGTLRCHPTGLICGIPGGGAVSGGNVPGGRLSFRSGCALNCCQRTCSLRTSSLRTGSRLTCSRLATCWNLKRSGRGVGFWRHSAGSVGTLDLEMFFSPPRSGPRVKIVWRGFAVGGWKGFRSGGSATDGSGRPGCLPGWMMRPPSILGKGVFCARV